MSDVHFSGLDFSNQDEIKRIARIHQEAPLDWIEDFQVSEQAIEQTYQFLIDSKDDAKTHVMVARNANSNLIGFHWISIAPENDHLAHIKSLWVDESHRRKGIGRQLKYLGEAWMKQNGAKQVTTKVFYVNKKMIDFNIKEGFKAGQLQMTKELV